MYFKKKSGGEPPPDPLGASAARSPSRLRRSFAKSHHFKDYYMASSHVGISGIALSAAVFILHRMRNAAFDQTRVHFVMSKDCGIELTSWRVRLAKLDAGPVFYVQFLNLSK